MGLMLNMCCQLAAIELGENIKNPRIDRNGPRAIPQWESFVMGVPLSWSQLEAMPDHGVLEATYTCSLDCARLNARHRLASAYGGWTAVPGEGSPCGALKWWAVLSDVPPEVVTLLEFL